MGYHQLTKDRYDLARAMYAAGLNATNIATALGLTPRNTKKALEHTWAELEQARIDHRNKYKKVDPKDQLQTIPPMVLAIDPATTEHLENERKFRAAQARDFDDLGDSFEPATKQDIEELKDFIVKHFKGKKVRWIS